RAEARGFIEGDNRRMEEIRKEVFRKYAQDLKVRFFRAKACFTNNQQLLHERGSSLPEMFNNAFKDIETFGGQDFLALPRGEIKPDDIQKSFEPGVRQVERLLPKLLTHLEEYEHVREPQTPRIEHLLERANDCEKRRSEQQPADQGFPSEQ